MSAPAAALFGSVRWSICVLVGGVNLLVGLAGEILDLTRLVGDIYFGESSRKSSRRNRVRGEGRKRRLKSLGQPGDTAPG